MAEMRIYSYMNEAEIEKLKLKCFFYE